MEHRTPQGPSDRGSLRICDGRDRSPQAVASGRQVVSSCPTPSPSFIASAADGGSAPFPLCQRRASFPPPIPSYRVFCHDGGYMMELSYRWHEEGHTPPTQRTHPLSTVGTGRAHQGRGGESSGGLRISCAEVGRGEREVKNFATVSRATPQDPSAGAERRGWARGGGATLGVATALVAASPPPLPAYSMTRGSWDGMVAFIPPACGGTPAPPAPPRWPRQSRPRDAKAKAPGPLGRQQRRPPCWRRSRSKADCPTRKTGSCASRAVAGTISPPA